ncbi:hypothetical protein ACGFYZ_21840 [Streptomyces sp. NPDC048330]|uniref:hypothetical protein n=1 Tax=Streptomyces sp. NPDC048330 TaxID=3365533 RepID=UPI003714EB71
MRRKQPVAFLGSECETAVVAPDLAAFLRLLADGLGPCEAASPYGPVTDADSRPHEELTAVALRYAPDRRASAPAVIAAAAREFPDFGTTVMELCR